MRGSVTVWQGESSRFVLGDPVAALLSQRRRPDWVRVVYTLLTACEVRLPLPARGHGIDIEIAVPLADKGDPSTVGRPICSAIESRSVRQLSATGSVAAYDMDLLAGFRACLACERDPRGVGRPIR